MQIPVGKTREGRRPSILRLPFRPPFFVFRRGFQAMQAEGNRGRKPTVSYRPDFIGKGHKSDVVRATCRVLLTHSLNSQLLQRPRFQGCPR